MDATHQIAHVGKVILGAAVLADEKIRDAFTTSDADAQVPEPVARPRKRRMKRKPKKATT